MSQPGYQPVIGQRFQPQETFFDAQRRNRRATWRMSALCVVAAVIMGIPIALVITPLLYAGVLITADIISLFSPLPPAWWQQAGEIARLGFTAIGWLTQQKPADPQALAWGATVLLLPGAVLSVLLWMGVTAMFRHGGVGGALLALKAREPNPSDLKELQLSDVVQEMAIAAGQPAPRVMLVDAPGANAAAIGTSPADARIVISRRLLDELTREECESVLGHLIASIGNGDLRVAFRVIAVFETCGLLVALINSPFGPQSRHVLWQILRFGVVGSRKDGAEASVVADVLTRNVAPDTDDIDRFFDPATKKSVFRSIRNFLFFPIFFTNVAIKLSLWFFSATILGPSLALLWRTRRYLADASAIQLTRDPDSLAAALNKLNEDGGAIADGGWAAPLFIISPKAVEHDSSSMPDRGQQETLARAWMAAGSQKAASEISPSEFPALMGEFTSTVRAAFAGDTQALARVQTFKQTLAATDPTLASQIPNLEDLAAARQGDRAAIARLRTLHAHASAAQESAPPAASKNSSQSSDVSSLSFLSFHPSVNRRLKRLARMGASVKLAQADPGQWKIGLFLAVLLGPFVVLLIALFLLLIAVMTMASLTFLAIWLALIHGVFGLFAHA